MDKLVVNYMQFLYNTSMEQLNSLLERYEKYKQEKKPAPHEKAAAVNEIIKILGESKIYNYSYWLRKVGSASYSTVVAILKEAQSLESKYSKGGFVTNKLKPYAISSIKSKTTGTNRRRDTGNKKNLGQVRTKTVRKVDDTEGSLEPDTHW